MTRIRQLMARAALALGLLPLGAVAETREVTIAYQQIAGPMVVAIANGSVEKATGYKVSWRQFDSGAKVATAMASGDVQVGVIGSSPLAAAVSRGLDLELFWILDDINEAEALVVRNGSGINSPADLKGKKLGVPFVSTTHFHTMFALETWGIKPSDVQILNMQPNQIAAAWQRGDIDAAFVWDPALGKLLESGKVLLTAKQAAERGAVTFGALVATGDLVKDHSDFVQKFVKITDKYYRDAETHPENWTATSENVKALSKFTGAKPEDIAQRIKVSVYIPAGDQASPQWLGGGEGSKLAAVLKDTAQFLKEQQKINAVLDSYAAFVDPRFVQATLASN
jgi:taurine transport system substrate-binding protein